MPLKKIGKDKIRTYGPQMIVCSGFYEWRFECDARIYGLGLCHEGYFGLYLFTPFYFISVNKRKVFQKTI